MAQLKDLLVNGNTKLIGEATAVTPAAGTSNTEVATTEFVHAAVNAAISSVTRTSADMTVSGATVTAPAGYYAANASKGVATATRADTTLTSTADTTNAKLTFTASNNQSTGYVTGANKTATKTVTLTASANTVTASDGTNSVSKTISAGTIDVTDKTMAAGAMSGAWNSDHTKYNITQAPATSTMQSTVTTAGYVSSSVGTKNTGALTVTSASLVLNKVATGATITGTLTKAPTLARTAKPSGDTWIDAASGAATTTKPTSGPYVQIDAAASTGTLTATPVVTSAGYGDSTYYTSTAKTATVGAAKATTAYVPIKVASSTITVGTATATANAGTASITTQPTASATLTRTGDIGTTTAPSGTAGTDYWAVTANASANSGVITATGGSARAQVSLSAVTVTTGYNTTDVTASAAAQDTGNKTGNTATTTAQTASATSSVYLVKAAGSVTGNNLSGTNAMAVYTTDGTNAGVNISAVVGTKATTEPTTGYYIALRGSSTASAQTQTAKITTAGYIPVVSSFATRSVSYSATTITNYFPITAAVHTLSGGGLTQGTASGGGLSGGDLSGGAVSATCTATVTTNPAVTPVVGGTGTNATSQTNYGLTTTKPSGTDGTNFITFDPNAVTQTVGVITATGVGSRAAVTRATVTRAAYNRTVTRATISCNHTAGYIPAGDSYTNSANSTVSLSAGYLAGTSLAAADSTEATASVNVTPSVNAGSNWYMPIVSPAFDGGGLTKGTASGGGLSGGGLTAGAGSVSAINQTGLTIAETTAGYTGVKFSATGSGSVSRAAVTRAAFSQQVTRAAVLYNGAVHGAVNKADNAQALAADSTGVTVSLAADSTTIGATSATSNSATKYYNITAINVPKDIAFTVNTTADTALDATSNINVNVAANRRASVTNATTSSNITANNNYGTITASNNMGTITIDHIYATSGNVSINAFDNAATPAKTGTQSVVSSGKWVQHTITPSGATQGPFYGSTTVLPTSGPSLEAKSTAALTVGTAISPSSGYTGMSSYTFNSNGTLTVPTGKTVTVQNNNGLVTVCNLGKTDTQKVIYNCNSTNTNGNILDVLGTSANAQSSNINIGNATTSYFGFVTLRAGGVNTISTVAGTTLTTFANYGNVVTFNNTAGNISAFNNTGTIGSSLASDNNIGTIYIHHTTSGSGNVFVTGKNSEAYGTGGLVQVISLGKLNCVPYTQSTHTTTLDGSTTNRYLHFKPSFAAKHAGLSSTGTDGGAGSTVSANTWSMTGLVQLFINGSWDTGVNAVAIITAQNNAKISQGATLSFGFTNSNMSTTAPSSVYNYIVQHQCSAVIVHLYYCTATTAYLDFLELCIPAAN